MHISEPDSPPEDVWIAVGRLLRPQGRRGEILIEPLTDLPEVFTPGCEFRLALDDRKAGTANVVTLEDCWRPVGRNAGRLVLKLAGVDSITAAESMEGQELFLREAQLPDRDPDTFFVRDLVGCALFDDQQHLGTVTDLQFPVSADGRTRLPDAVDLLVVQRVGAPEENETVLVPFVKAWLVAVDLDLKKIEMHLPPGLMD